MATNLSEMTNDMLRMEDLRQDTGQSRQFPVLMSDETVSRVDEQFRRYMVVASERGPTKFYGHPVVIDNTLAPWEIRRGNE